MTVNFFQFISIYTHGDKSSKKKWEDNIKIDLRAVEGGHRLD